MVLTLSSIPTPLREHSLKIEYIVASEIKESASAVWFFNMWPVVRWAIPILWKRMGNPIQEIPRPYYGILAQVWCEHARRRRGRIDRNIRKGNCRWKHQTIQRRIPWRSRPLRQFPGDFSHVWRKVKELPISQKKIDLVRFLEKIITFANESGQG